MMNLLKAIDNFGIVYNLKTLGNEKFKSLTGACLTIATLALTTYLTFIFGQNFYYKINPTVLETDIEHESSQEIVPTTATHPFMMRIEKETNVFNPPDFPVRLNLDYFHWERDDKNKEERKCFASEIKVNCAETELKDSPLYTIEEFSTFWCIDFKKVQEQCAEQTKDPNYKPFIGGDTSTKRYGYVRMQATNAEWNNTGNIYQAKLAEVKKIEKPFYVDLRYPKFYLKKDQFANALTTRTYTERHQCYTHMFRADIRHLKQVSLKDDIGWLNEKIDKSSSLDNDTMITQQWTNLLDKEGFIGFYGTIFYLGKNERVVNRRFMKLPDVFAQVAGTMKPIMINFMFFMTLYNLFQRDKLLVDQLFEQAEDKKQSKVQVDTFVGESKVEESTVNIKKPKKIVTPGFFVYYSLICHKNSESLNGKKFYDAAKDYIERKMDVRALFELHERFNNLIELTLTEEQKEDITKTRTTKLALIN